MKKEIKKEKHAGGRPLTYDKDKTPGMILAYLKNCEDKRTSDVKTNGLTTTSYELGWNVKVPSIEGLAVFLDVSRETIYDWDKKYPEFSDILRKLQAKQTEMLIDGGLSGRYNPTIAKLLLSKQGYVEKQEITGKDGADLNRPVEIKIIAPK
jgi:DNA-packaging protein gp3